MLKEKKLYVWMIIICALLIGNLVVSYSIGAPENDTGCVDAAAGPEKPAESNISESNQHQTTQVMARVGQPAPDFEATALVNDKFEKVRLSDYKGQWVVLCFYPGDFTFV